jgi:hypothetical protein
MVVKVEEIMNASRCSEYLSQAEDVIYPRDLGQLSANKKKGRSLIHPIRLLNIYLVTNEIKGIVA